MSKLKLNKGKIYLLKKNNETKWTNTGEAAVCWEWFCEHPVVMKADCQFLEESVKLMSDRGRSMNLGKIKTTYGLKSEHKGAMHYKCHLAELFDN